MDVDNEDILTSVKAHGIRSPFNLHAIKSTFILWPTVCGSCEKTIYPFSSVVMCIRCKVIFHRGPCMRDTKKVCEHAMIKKDNTTSADDLVVVEGKISVESCRKPVETELQSSEPIAVVNIDSMPSQHATVDTTTTTTIKQNEEALLRNDVKTDIVPVTVIISSVWSSKARSLASSQLQRLERLPFSIPSSSSNPIDENTLKKLQLFVHHTLVDSSSFPCKVCSALHATYMNMKFTTQKDVLVNGRACLDAVTASFLSILPSSMEINKSSNTTLLPPGIEEAVSHAVDRYMLAMARTSMYEKLYHAAKISTEEQDQHWRSIVLIPNGPSANATSTTTSMAPISSSANTTSTAATATTINTISALPSTISNHHTDGISASHKHAKNSLLRVADFLSPKDKLVQMCVALNCLTTTKQSHLGTSVSNLTAPSQSAQSNFTAMDTQQSSSSIIDSTAPQFSRPFFDDDHPSHSTDIVEDNNAVPNDCVVDPTNHVSNVDYVSNVATSDVLELSMVDTDELIEKLACLLIDTGKDINWYAECHYIEHMMHQEGVWIYGQECYALTTMMQALQSSLSS